MSLPTKPRNGLEPAENLQQHQTVRFYVIGFMLSLLLTAIPYYLVVNQTLTGKLLLTVIVGIAFTQMAVQLIFFLHLGRGPKPLYNVGFFFGTFGALLIVIGGSIFIMDHLRTNVTAIDTSRKLTQDEGIYAINGEKTGACKTSGKNHKIMISDGMAMPSAVAAKLCDTMTFIKQDDISRQITFGNHSKQAGAKMESNYAGETELTLSKDRGKTMTLSKPGTFQFHDHLNPGVTGQFTVTP